MQKSSENIEFYKVTALNNLFYELIPFSIESTDTKTNFHIKISDFKNISKKDKIRNISSDQKDQVISDNKVKIRSGKKHQINHIIINNQKDKIRKIISDKKDHIISYQINHIIKNTSNQINKISFTFNN